MPRPHRLALVVLLALQPAGARAARTTTDGRLLIRTVYPWALSFVPYRPENVQHDWKSGPTPALPARFHEKLHPLIWLDPRNTRWTDLNPEASSGQDPKVPVALHNTICEDNDVAVNAGNRSPRACSATYSVCGGNDQANCANITTQVYAGDCYDITLIADTSNEAVDQWEMRSVDLTVFVPNSKRHDTGDAGAVLPDQRSVLVYPRQSRPADPNPWILPEWSFKEVNGQKNFTRGYDPNHE